MKIESYKSGNSDSGSTMIAIVLFGALAYFGYKYYQENKLVIDKVV
jgi:predicted negative regulator of RcsB-dependent stress response